MASECGESVFPSRSLLTSDTPHLLGLAFDPTKQQTLDAAGQKVDNAFPYRYLDPTTGQVADPEAAPPIAAPPLLGVPAAPSASATASPSPTNGKR